MNVLDLFGGWTCIWMAFVIFVLEIVTSARKSFWPTLPRYVRFGLFATGAAMLYRGVNFVVLSQSAPDGKVLGHLNTEGLIASVCMAYTMSALATYVVTRSPQVQVWMARGLGAVLGALPPGVLAWIGRRPEAGQ